MVVARRDSVLASVREFKGLAAGIHEFIAALDEGELFNLRHENMVASPRDTIEAICDFLGLAPYPEFIDTCAAAIFTQTTDPRLHRQWTDVELKRVEEELIANCSWLAGYHFDSQIESTAG